MTYRIVVQKGDGSETDVTEGVKALYDHTVSSLDWGSGFLEVDDAREILNVALTCGFLMPEAAQAEFECYARGMSSLPCADCHEPAHWDYPLKAWRHGVQFSQHRKSDHPVRVWPLNTDTTKRPRPLGGGRPRRVT